MDERCYERVRQVLLRRRRSATGHQGARRVLRRYPLDIYADLGELAAGLKSGREGEGERIFSMNMGIAVDDVVTAKVLYERALERGAGVRLPL